MAEEKKKKGIFAIIVSVLSYILLAVALFIFLSVSISRAQGKIPSVFGLSLHVVATPSMQTGEQDSIDVGTVVFVKECDLTDVTVGTVILFEPYPQPVITTAKGEITANRILHRVMSIDPSSGEITATKGDANVGEDTFSVRVLYGKMVGQSRFLGRIVTYLLSPNSINILFGGAIVVLLIMIAGLIVKIIAGLKHPEQQTTVINQEQMRLDIEQRLREEMGIQPAKEQDDTQEESKKDK